MKRMFYITLTIFVFVGLLAWVRTLSPDPAYPEEALTSDICTFIDHRITNSASANLGTIKNVVVDMKDGHPIYVVVSFDDPAFKGKTAMIPHKNKIVPIPWEKLTFGPAQGAILLEADETMLANSPQLDNPSQGIGPNLDAEIQQYWVKAEEGEPCCPCRWCPVWWN
ncbi:MAG: PRC-barrel domain-containing protein [Anaerolineae bacterium]|nr:PRC-barrel domain-containing protein [Anaerolineae bacterium]